MTNLPAPGQDARTGTAKRRVRCPDCKTERVVYGDKSEARCRSCAAAARRTGREVSCPGCGVAHWVTPSMEAKGIRHCSISCFNSQRNPILVTEEHRQKLSRGKRGERNPNYRHGRSDDPGRGWSLEAKGEGQCRACTEPAVHLHHAVPRAVNPAGKRDLRNGLPLCRSCHFSWHRSATPPFTRDVFAIEEWEFIKTLVPLTWLDMRYPRAVRDAGSVEAARLRLTWAPGVAA